MHTFLISLVSFIVALGILVLVHEFGHFLAAKLCGVRVEQFSIGFPPRLFGIKIGDTDYCISATPLGGYVKMTGESMPGENLSLQGADGATIEAQKSDPGALTSHPRWQRIIIGLAGPFANFVLALVLMTGFYMLHNEVAIYEDQPIQLDWVVPELARGQRPASSRATPSSTSTDRTRPTWQQVFEHCDAESFEREHRHSVPLTVERGGQPDCRDALLLDASGNVKPEDFALDKLGLLPVMQPGPVRVSSVSPTMPAARPGCRRATRWFQSTATTSTARRR
jgi:regulator of sigma E protease